MKSEPKIKRKVHIRATKQPVILKHMNKVVTHGCKGLMEEGVGKRERKTWFLSIALPISDSV